VRPTRPNPRRTKGVCGVLMLVVCIHGCSKASLAGTGRQS
jgi:hypothetical protein